MRPRVVLAQFFINLGTFIQSLAAPLMRPDDLVEFGRRHYGREHSVEFWAANALTDSGLDPEEKALLDKVPSRSGRALVLCLGGGREAFALARMGFEVTGVDFVPNMVERVKANAAERGVRIEGLVQEISALDVPAGSYDMAWLSAAMYSCIPTRARRVTMLQRVARALRPGGFFICRFYFDRDAGRFCARHVLRKAFGFLTLGNLRYERGDVLFGNAEFLHAFSSEAELRTEFEEGGFEMIEMQLVEEKKRGGVVLLKAEG